MKILKYVSLSCLSFIFWACQKKDVQAPLPIVTPVHDTTIASGNSTVYLVTLTESDRKRGTITIVAPALTQNVVDYGSVDAAIWFDNSWHNLPFFIYYVQNSTDANGNGTSAYLAGNTIKSSYYLGYVKIDIEMIHDYDYFKGDLPLKIVVLNV
ncbi:hypothetical protein ACI6Q2_20045 [Chitinophagaceae bacterium LWZ2-11]